MYTRAILALIGVLLLGVPALARDLTINDQQQQAVYVICEKAARSPANSLDEIVSIGTFCQSWRDAVNRNNAAAPAPDKPAAEEK